MKRKLLVLPFSVSFAAMLTTLNAQTLFLENFETAPVTSILNIWNSETQLTQGPSPCGLASRGNTANFNSTNVNFNNAQNSTYFLAVNPQSPCGGFYSATLASSSQNFSSQDSLRFSCRYFKSTTLGWGVSILRVIISNGTTNDTISTQFSVVNSWSTVDIALPSYLIAPAVTITIDMGGGEGAALDDIKIMNIPPLGIHHLLSGKMNEPYPNPFTNEITFFQSGNESNELTIYNVLGEMIIHEKISSNLRVQTENWESGIYFYELKNEHAILASGKIMKR